MFGWAAHGEGGVYLRCLRLPSDWLTAWRARPVSSSQRAAVITDSSPAAARASRLGRWWRLLAFALNGPSPPILTSPLALQMKFVSGGNNKYSTRRVLGPVDKFYQCCGLTACRLCLPCSFCCKFIEDTPYRVQTMPFYGESGEDVNAEDGQAPLGKFIFVDQLKPFLCCCIPWGVRSNIKISQGAAAPDQSEVTLLALYTQAPPPYIYGGNIGWPACSGDTAWLLPPVVRRRTP
jgi:hypothetical protein